MNYDPFPIPKAFITTDESNDDEFGPGLSNIYNEHIAVKAGKSTIRPPHTLDPSEDYIAQICTSRIDLKALIDLDTTGELGEVLPFITDPHAFRKLFIPGALDRISSERQFSTSISKHLLHNLPDLEKFGVLERTPVHASVVMPTFKVDKRSGGKRFVADGRKLNSLMSKPPQMKLPFITDVIQRILSSKWVCMGDGRSWFYQFELHPEIRKYFGVNVAGGRGKFIRTLFKVLCMGWSHAPCIAQRSARTLLPEADGITWIDNFIVCALSHHEAAFRFKAFLSRCKKVNAEINTSDEFYGEPVQKFSVLGIQFNLEHQEFRSDPDWVNRLCQKDELRKLEEGLISPRGFYALFGSIVWHSYTTNSPMLHPSIPPIHP